MNQDAQEIQRDEYLEGLLRENMIHIKAAALAGAASAGRLPGMDEADILSHVLEGLLRMARRGDAINNIVGLTFQIGRRRAVDLERKRRIAARWVATARVIERQHAQSPECHIARLSHARLVMDVAGRDVIALALALADAPGAPPAARKRISRARERVRQVSAELF